MHEFCKTGSTHTLFIDVWFIGLFLIISNIFQKGEKQSVKDRYAVLSVEFVHGGSVLVVIVGGNPTSKKSLWHVVITIRDQNKKKNQEKNTKHEQSTHGLLLKLVVGSGAMEGWVSSVDRSHSLCALCRNWMHQL